jgi:hypothetical protein
MGFLFPGFFPGPWYTNAFMILLFLVNFMLKDVNTLHIHNYKHQIKTASSHADKNAADGKNHDVIE